MSKNNIECLDTRLTFENFVEGYSNKFAYSAALAVSEGDFSTYNPLFIYGSTGLGKTHLMYAIANRIREKFPKMTMRCMDSESFTKEVLDALRKAKQENTQEQMEKLREMFRVDLFMLDDIQFLKGRNKTLETFFYIFNNLHLHQKQMVITSSESPQDIGIGEQLHSRFAAGFQVEIKPPTLSECASIIIRKSEELGIVINEQFVFYLAENIVIKDVRQLIGVLRRIKIYASTYNVPISKEIIREALDDI
jgi:chromosomal replication initiator protein